MLESVYLLPFVNTPGFYFLLDALLALSMKDWLPSSSYTLKTNKEKEIPTVVILLSGGQGVHVCDKM